MPKFSILSFLLTGSLFLAILATVSPSQADVVYLKDGSRIMGTIGLISDNTLVIETGFAGKLRIEMQAIDGLSTEQPVTTAFSTGDHLVGAVEYEPDQKKTVVLHSQFGRIDVTDNPIRALWPKAGEDPEVTALRHDKSVAETQARPQWSARVEGGGTVRTGNTDRIHSRAALDIRRKTPGDLLRFYASARYAEDNNRRTENELRGGILYENKFYEKWYWFTNLDLEHDEFRDLDLRTSLTAGIGYYWIEQPNHELKTRLGLGFRHESYSSVDRKNSKEMVGNLAWDYRADLNSWARFTHSGVFEPSFEDFNDYQLDLDTGLAFPLGRSDFWRLKLGMSNEYKYHPARNRREWDNLYYANIILEWE